MSKNFAAVSAVIMALISLTNVQASNDNAGDWYFSPVLSYIKADNDRQAEDDYGLQLGFGKKLNERWNIEVSAAADTLGFETGSGEYKQRGLIMDGQYFFERNTVLQTFGIVGAGFMETDMGTNDSMNPLINVGIGMMQQISVSGMKFRADIRYRMDMDDNSVPSEDKFNDMVLNIGLVIPFGDAHKSKSGFGASEIAGSKDSDKDGVLDNNDKCKSTAVGVKVDEKGCKAEQKNIDSAKATVKQIEETDIDSDGVVDSNDQCPNTAAGVNVDIKGCELQQSYVLKGVVFVTGSDVLTQESKKFLDDVAATLNKNKDLNVEVAGYTDDRGNVGFNKHLSQKRAGSVRAYLVAAGVNSKQLTARGYGSDYPIADNGTSEGRSQNRRVELHILK